MMGRVTSARSMSSVRVTSRGAPLWRMAPLSSRRARSTLSCLGALLTAANAPANDGSAPGAVSAAARRTQVMWRARNRSTMRSDTVTACRAISRDITRGSEAMPLAFSRSAIEMRFPSWSRICTTLTSLAESRSAGFSSQSGSSSTKVSLSSFSPAGARLSSRRLWHRNSSRPPTARAVSAGVGG